MARIAVIGGGISGLAAAYRLQELGQEVVLLEAGSRLGGILHTERVAGFLIDTGPDSFLSSKPAALKLADELGLQDQIINTRDDGGGTFILHNGKLTPLPEGLTMLVPTQLSALARSPLLSVAGKLRLAAEYFIPASKSKEDESIGQFVTRRLGRETYENIAEPLLSGIYSGDANELSLRATFPRLKAAEIEHGGVIRGAMAMKKKAGQGQTRNGGPTPFVSFKNGLGELIDGLGEALESADIRLNQEIKAIEQRRTGYTVTLADGTDEYDAVLLTTPAHATARLVEDLAPGISSELDEIQYASTATVSLAFDAATVSSAGGRGFVVPRKEGRALKAVTWSSQKFAGRAPDGAVLLRGFVGRAGDQRTPVLPDDEIVSIVRRELAEILGINAQPQFTRVYRFIDAMPQYTLGHPARVERIERLVTGTPGLELAGNAYHGVGIPDCISTATSAADRLVAKLS